MAGYGQFAGDEKAALNAEWDGPAMVRHAPVFAALSAAREQAEKLGAMVHGLRDNLSTVLQPESPMKQVPGDSARDCQPESPLRQQIDAVTTTLLDAQNVVRSITDRLDV